VYYVKRQKIQHMRRLAFHYNMLSCGDAYPCFARQFLLE
jgi:hypothetical protein